MVKLSDLKAGDTIQLDRGFTCTSSGPARVKVDKLGLYFRCNDGKHYLAGQEDKHGVLVGISKE